LNFDSVIYLFRSAVVGVSRDVAGGGATGAVRRNKSYPTKFPADRAWPSACLIEPIAHTRLADDQQRVRRINFDLLPQLTHEDSEVLNVARVTTPSLLDQLLMRHHESGMGRKRMKERILLSCQLHAPSVQRHHPRHHIDRKRAGSHHRIPVGAPQMPPQGRLAPRQQFRNPEWFDYIIVGTQPEQPNLFLLIRLNRENDDGNVRPRTNALEHLGSFEVGQVKVQNNQIRAVEGRSLEPDIGVLRFEHGKSMKLEAGAEKTPDLCFIINDKHFSH
jgi:hypothetical protein